MVCASTRFILATTCLLDLFWPRSRLSVPIPKKFSRGSPRTIIITEDSGIFVPVSAKYYHQSDGTDRATSSRFPLPVRLLLCINLNISAATETQPIKLAMGENCEESIRSCLASP